MGRAQIITDNTGKAAKTTVNPAVTALRTIGAKVTGPRVRIMETLGRAATPVTHRELLDRLCDGGGEQIDRVTVYRVLDWLVAMSLAHKAADEYGVFRFSTAAASAAHDSHVHFRCSRCGGVFCLKDAPPARPRLPRGFRLTRMSVDIQGECARCAGAH